MNNTELADILYKFTRTKSSLCIKYIDDCNGCPLNKKIKGRNFRNIYIKEFCSNYNLCDFFDFGAGYFSLDDIKRMIETIEKCADAENVKSEK